MFIREIKLGSQEANWSVSWYCNKKCQFFFLLEWHLMGKVKWGFTEAREQTRRCYLRKLQTILNKWWPDPSVGLKLLFSLTFSSEARAARSPTDFLLPKRMCNFSLGRCRNDETLTQWVSIRTKWVWKSIFILNGAFLLNTIFQNFILVSVEYLNRFKF